MEAALIQVWKPARVILAFIQLASSPTRFIKSWPEVSWSNKCYSMLGTFSNLAVKNGGDHSLVARAGDLCDVNAGERVGEAAGEAEEEEAGGEEREVGEE